MRMTSAPFCYLCGSQGNLLYSGLKDRLFGAPGEWSLRKCSNPECGLVWLDPMPIEEDISKAYQDYYTHEKEGEERKGRNIEIVLKKVLRFFFRGVLRMTLISRQRWRQDRMYLDKQRPGKLLEVGCGDGSRLNKMRKMGWDVEGQEVDPEAAGYAKTKYDLIVHLGDLKSLRLPESSFDAVIMNHVIEHVYEPVALLAECRRILKPNGLLMAITPNIESYGHGYFGPNCRILEPPRHIHIFSQKTLKQVAVNAGFEKCETWTTPAKAESIATGSYEIEKDCFRETDKYPLLSIYLSSILFQIMASATHIIRPDTGEECILKAVK